MVGLPGDELDGVVRLEGRAAEHLSFIRETMARSVCFTAVCGWGVMAMGGIALAGAWVASLRLTAGWWLACWAVIGVVACGVGVGAMCLKARRCGVPVLGGAGRKFLLNFSPAILAGCILGGVLYREGLYGVYPGMWLLLYGVGVVTGGAYSVGVIPVAGVCFMILGSAGLFMPGLETVVWGPLRGADVLLAFGFGGIHLIMGWVIARRYGG